MDRCGEASAASESELHPRRRSRLPEQRAGHIAADIRPVHRRIMFCDAGEGQCAGRVDVIEYLGADTFMVVDCGRLGACTIGDWCPEIRIVL